MFENNINGMKLEKNGNTEKAIELYEKNVKNRFEGSFPYKRLAIIYTKMKRYEDAKKVLEIAVDIFEKDVCYQRGDRLPKLSFFRGRLEKINKKLKDEPQSKKETTQSKSKKQENYDFSDEEILLEHEKLLLRNKNFSRNDAIWSLLNKEQFKFAVDKKWKNFAICKFHMVSFLVNEKKYLYALPHLCQVLYVNLSGVDDIDLDVVKERIELLSVILDNCKMSIEDFYNYFINRKFVYIPTISNDYFNIESKTKIIYEVLLKRNIYDAIKKYPHNCIK